VILKAYRKLATGIQPEIEIGRFLVDVAGFANTPPLLGTIERSAAEGERTALAAAFGFVRNQGDGWVYTIEYLSKALEELHLLASAPEPLGDAAFGERDADEAHAAYLALIRVLGQRTAELHHALATPTDDPAFAAEPIGGADMATWRRAVRRQADAAFTAIRRASTSLAKDQRGIHQALLAARTTCNARIDELTAEPVEAAKTRLHGDYHLGQVLIAQNDFYILDFEGEPARSLAERRAKQSPIKDVAGMLRSFDYAAWTTALDLAARETSVSDLLLPLAQAWRQAAERAFLEGYRGAIVGCPSWPADELAAEHLLELFLLEKALYEICYEAANRPSWLPIPMKGLARLLELELPA
jgi:maltose alpha-D-glucosyltransferase/alpha-amylase